MSKEFGKEEQTLQNNSFNTQASHYYEYVLFITTENMTKLFFVAH